MENLSKRVCPFLHLGPLQESGEKDEGSDVEFFSIYTAVFYIPAKLLSPPQALLTPVSTETKITVNQAWNLGGHEHLTRLPGVSLPL